KISYDEAKKLAIAGESGDAAKAIADMRERSRASMAISRAKKSAGVQRCTRKTPVKEVDWGGDKEDDEPREEEAEDWGAFITNKNSMLMAMAMRDFAENPDMAKVVRKIAEGWDELATSMESEPRPKLGRAGAIDGR